MKASVHAARAAESHIVQQESQFSDCDESKFLSTLIRFVQKCIIFSLFWPSVHTEMEFLSGKTMLFKKAL